MSTEPKRPAIKFLKRSTEDILSGRKTLELRARSIGWIERIQRADIVDLTYGPRMSRPTVFATAKIEKVEIRPFDTITPDDLKRIGYGWELRTIDEFIPAYTEWYAKELAKGYPVAWIYFSVIEPKL
jgi:hypothetical protein